MQSATPGGMWRRRKKRKQRAYSADSAGFEALQADLALIVSNCRLFWHGNPAGAEVLRCAAELEEHAAKACKQRWDEALRLLKGRRK